MKNSSMNFSPFKKGKMFVWNEINPSFFHPKSLPSDENLLLKLYMEHL